eukprot:g14201.t1
MAAKMTPPELTNSLWALARLRLEPSDKVLDGVTASACPERWKPQDITNALWAFSVLQYQPSSEFMQALTSESQRRLSQFKADELALKRQKVHPSFSLPSSYHAVRAHVPASSIQEVCEKHPHEEFKHLCYREALVVPLLNPKNTNLDNQVYRAHVERPRRCLNNTGSFTLASEDCSVLGAAIG